MKRSFVGVWVIVAALALVLGGAQTVLAGPMGDNPELPVFPDFSSYGNLSFNDGTGYGWWGMDQYSDRTSVNIGANTMERVISMQSGMTVDKEDSSWFSFNVSIRTLDGATPTGRLDFRTYSSSGNNSLSAQVRDTLVDIWDGWDEVNGLPIYHQEMQTQFHADLFAVVQLNGLNDSLGRWTSEWINGEGEIYYSQTGDEYRVDGYGSFLGDDPAAIGLALVESGAAKFGTVVPEPATMCLLGLGGLGALLRRRRRR